MIVILKSKNSLRDRIVLETGRQLRPFFPVILILHVNRNIISTPSNLMSSVENLLLVDPACRWLDSDFSVHFVTSRRRSWLAFGSTLLVT